MLPEIIRHRHRAYKRTFEGREAALVLADLARFCHAQATTHVVNDTHGSAQLEGRRQVWLRIQGYLRLDEAALNQLIEEANQ